MVMPLDLKRTSSTPRSTAPRSMLWRAECSGELPYRCFRTWPKRRCSQKQIWWDLTGLLYIGSLTWHNSPTPRLYIQYTCTHPWIWETKSTIDQVYRNHSPDWKQAWILMIDCKAFWISLPSLSRPCSPMWCSSAASARPALRPRAGRRRHSSSGRPLGPRRVDDMDY